MYWIEYRVNQQRSRTEEDKWSRELEKTIREVTFPAVEESIC